MAFYKLHPHLVKKVWGGDFLHQSGPERYPYSIGESLEISTLEHFESNAIINLKETKLSEILNNKLSYLVKFLDTNDNLSIQVHPNNHWAEKLEHSSGKTECWLILESQKDAGIYLGFKDGVTKNQLKASLNDKAQIDQMLNFYKVNPGDFFYVPAGSIHAIGKGIVLVEIQQSSGITYRVWDWNRRDQQGQSRELHIDKALQVLTFEQDKNESDHFLFKKNLFSIKNAHQLITHTDFEVWLYCLEKDQNILFNKESQQGDYSIVFLDGKGVCQVDNEAEYMYSKFESFYKSGDNIINVKADKKTFLLKIS